MADTHNAPRRGRPKGTGINDAELLGRIGDLLRAEPLLKSTSAIKRIGISDPSIIRRLRDKLKSGTKAEAYRSAASFAAPPAPQSAKTSAPTSLQPASARTAERISPPPNDHPNAGLPSTPHSNLTNPAETEQEKRTRNALLLAAYLEALAKSAPQADTAQPRAPQPERPAPFTVAPDPPNVAEPAPRPPVPPPRQPKPAAPAAPFHFPGMPPFLQPFRQPAAAQSPTTTPTNQLEGMKLAVEAMTSMAKLQLHITENAMAYSPMALMLQGQAFVGQMLLASFTGQLDASKRKPPDGK